MNQPDVVMAGDAMFRFRLGGDEFEKDRPRRLQVGQFVTSSLPLLLRRASARHPARGGPIREIHAMGWRNVRGRYFRLHPFVPRLRPKVHFIEALPRFWTTRRVEWALRETGFVVTVEEGCLMGGFGSAILKAASEMSLDTSRVKRLGIPDRFIEHVSAASCSPTFASTPRASPPPSANW